MKKIIGIIGWVIGVIIVLFAWYSYFGDKTSALPQKIISEELDQIYTDIPVWDEVTSQDLSPTQKTDPNFDVLRKRFALRGIITLWDTYASSHQPLLALSQYLKALKESPDDIGIQIKILNVYFEMKNFAKVREIGAEVAPHLTQEALTQYISALFATTDPENTDQIYQTQEALSELVLDESAAFYYTTSLLCLTDFHGCKKSFEEYFISHQDISFSWLLSIKKALQDYKNFQVNDLYYKDTLIAGAFFQNKLYSVSNTISQNILKDKPEYKPLLLILGKWYYELGDLWTARKYLESYYTLDPKNVQVSYLLGDICFRLKDYVTSNLYFNTALKNKFEPKSEILRKLAYNYYLAWDLRSMLNVFGSLLQEKTASIDDYSLGIYYAILQKRTQNAKTWSLLGIKKFENTPGWEIFYGYLGWIAREDGELKQAKELLEKWLKINGKNPLILLNLWYLEEASKNYPVSLIYFKRTVNLNWDGEFGTLAANEVIAVEKILENQRKEK